MEQRTKTETGEQETATEPSVAGSETERFRAVVDVKHNEAVTGESGVPAKQREHEQRCQKRSLDEFS
jgi:type V secretory pathway adhesin AidA